MKLVLASPRGFCAGVDRAIEIVERAIKLFGTPIYVRHEVVHNKYVVDSLRNRGAIFIEELHEVPDDSIIIFSAHGVSKAIQEEAQSRKLKIFDATCPLVTKVHMEVSRFSRDSYECILIGHSGHPEVEGTMGQFDKSNGGRMYLIENLEDVAALTISNPDKLSYVTQTTLSMDDTASIIDALRKRFVNIIGPKKDDICYATQNRQDAIKQIAEKSDVLFVVGSPNSSNSNRLRELSERLGTPAYLIDSESDINLDWIKDKETIGLSAGASAPEVLVQSVVNFLKEHGANEVVEFSQVKENIVFSLPKALKE